MTTTHSPATARNTVTATITCQHCRWSAQMTGDDLQEVGDFLRRRLLQHVGDHHTRGGNQ